MLEGTVGRWRQLAPLLFAGVLLFLSDPSLGAQRRVQRLSGQNVAPVYDGYEVNADGTFSMWFGYFNRNHEEALEIPIGPDNRFEPGTADRGQPTHFVPQWQKSSFRVVVPKDFGQQKITWRLTAKGRTETVVAALDPRSIIDRQQTTLEGTVGLNKAPLVSIEPAAQTVARGAPAAITVAATDDGLPVNTRTATALLQDGKSPTTATFSEPGEYVIQGVVDDGSLLAGTYCCWVAREVRVTVK